MTMQSMPKLRRAIATLVAVASSFSFAGFVAATNTIYPQNTTLVMTGPGITLLILAGSESDSLAVTSTTFTVTVAAGDSFTVRYPAPSPGTLANNGGINSCNLTGDNNEAVVIGPATVTFTPNTTICVPVGGRGGGTSTPATSVSVTNPDGGESLAAGETTQIQWSTSGTGINSITIRLSTDSGLTFPTLIASNLINSFSYNWAVPADEVTTTKARIKIEAVSSNGSSVTSSDTSSSDFEIRGLAGTPAPTILGPVVNAEALPGDSKIQLSWTNPTHADFAGVRILRKTGSVPTSTTDGVLIYEDSGMTILDTNLTNGLTYFYALYAYNNDKVFASEVIVSATPSANAVIPIVPEVPSVPAKPIVLVEFVDLPSTLTFKPGETFASNYLLHNNNTTTQTFVLARKVLDPSGKSLFLSSGSRVVVPGSPVKVEVSYTVPDQAVTGTYTMVVEVNIDGAKIGEAKLFFSVATEQSVLGQKLAGRILLDVQSHGEAWYVYPKDQQRYYLGRPDDAYALMRQLGLGITNANLNKIPAIGNGGSIPPDMVKYVYGYILLQVEARGEAWYVDPVTLKRRYMANGTDAFAIMRSLGLGITSADLATIPIGSL